MFIFKEHKHPGYVVLAGEKAINFAKPGDELLTVSHGELGRISLFAQT